MADEQRRVAAASLIEFARAAFGQLGMEPADAQLAAEILIDANLMGLDTHGIAHLDSHPGYAPGLRSGDVDPRPKLTVLRETAATALADANGGFGLIVAARAMDLAIEKARNAGVGVVALRNSRHCGAMGFYARRAVEAGMIGIAMTNCSPWVVPTNGKKKTLGTNPIAIGAPALHGPPFLLDIATSTVAMGKVETALRLKHQLAPGWALDGEARPTTDPAIVYSEGGLTPLGNTMECGSYKGYGLGVAVDILAGLLSATGWSLRLEKGTSQSGQFFMALKVQAFAETDAFLRDMSDLLTTLMSAEPAAGERVLFPGQREFEIRADRERNGVPLDLALLDRLNRFADKLGIARLSCSQGIP